MKTKTGASHFAQNLFPISLLVHILPAPTPKPHLTEHSPSPSHFPFQIPGRTETMADKENIFRFTRGSKKRAAEAATPDDRSANKKRVVLGELPILQNATSSVDRKSRSRATRQRRRVKSRDTAGTSAAAAAPEINTLPEGDVKLSDEGNSEDPQMCRVYASDIYEYLRAMEVWVFPLV